MMDIAGQMRDWIQSAMDDIPVAFGDFPRSATPRCMIKASPAEPWVRRYCSGGGIRRFVYEVYLQVRPLTEDDRLDGLARLRSVQSAIESTAQPEGVTVVTHKVDTMPAVFRVEENGTTTYQLIATIKYLI